MEGTLGKIDPLTIIRGGMMPAMEKVGDRFSSGEIYLPEMLMAAEAWDEAMKLLKPKILEAGDDEIIMLLPKDRQVIIAYKIISKARLEVNV